MTLSRKSKRSVVKDGRKARFEFDNDLLGFVNALEDMDVPEEEGDALKHLPICLKVRKEAEEAG